MIYFDSAATTFPKPVSVVNRVYRSFYRLGGNPGRGGHAMSMAAAAAVYRVREKAAAFFGASPENVVFTSNCTHSLNLAIKGLVENQLREGGSPHIIISSYEHNSVLRPVHELTKRGLRYSVAEVSADDDVTLLNLERLIEPSTRAIVCTLGSNVTGRLLPFAQIGELCRRRGICFVGDGAQACGTADIQMARDGINILCMPGHKGLYGMSGTGLLITDGSYPIYHITEGGTGSLSADPEQPDIMPDLLESGTVNTVGIVSVGAGLDFIKEVGRERIAAHEDMLCRRFIAGLEKTDGVRIYRRKGHYLPIVLFNVGELNSEETAYLLAQRGFALRGGLHCSPLAHRSEGTLSTGGVRFSPSCFNTVWETERLIFAVKDIAKGL